MAVNLSPVGGVAAQFFDNSGNVLTGGKLETYLAGTTTPAITYTTAAGNIAWSNPIVLDAAGRVSGSGEIWLTDGIQYKFILRDSNNVLIATYDNVIGINSNFVNFTNQQEIQIATAGQTVFNLATTQYQPGTNSLSVFVDGVNQYGPGAQYAYIETDQDTVTFTNGLHVGAEVKFTTSQLNTSGAIDAEQVSYTAPYTDSTPTNVEAKLSEYISFKDFGAAGDDTADDTIALQNAIDNSPIGSIIDGDNLVYLATQLNVNKAITIQNCVIHMKNPASAVTTQACFNITANDVRLLNCGSSVVTAEVTNITNAMGVLADLTTNLYIDSGVYEGSKSALGNFGVIHITNSNEPKVSNVNVKNSFGDGVFFGDCNNPQALSNVCENNGGSGVTADDCVGALISYNYIVDTGQSGLACNSSNSIVSFNYVKNPATNGITGGELVTENLQVVSNVVEGALQTPGIAAKYAGILIQQAQKAQVLNNIIREPQSGVVVCDGISFVNSPVSFECSGNIISPQTGGGITVVDTNNVCGGNITNNTIESPDFSGIDVLGFSRMIISGNIITNPNRSNDANGMGMYIDSGVTSPEFLTITNNVITDTTPYQRYAIYLASTMSASTITTIKGNTVRGWITNAYVGTRSCIYDVNNNDWDGTTKTGLVTLTNGGTSTVVTTNQCVLNTYPVLSLGNAAAATLNPVYRVSAVANGSFTITHTAGTAGGEQLRWVIN